MKFKKAFSVIVAVFIILATTFGTVVATAGESNENSSVNAKLKNANYNLCSAEKNYVENADSKVVFNIGDDIVYKYGDIISFEVDIFPKSEGS